MKCIHCKHFGGLIYLFLFFLNGFQAQVNTCDHQNKWLKYAATCSTSTRMPEVFDAAWDQWYGEASSCPDDAALLTPYYWKSRYFRAQARYDSAMYYVLKAEKIALYIKDGPLAKLYWRNTFEKGKVLLALSEFDLGVEVHVEYLNYA